MHRIRITPVKLLLMPTMKNNLNQGSANLLELVTPTCALVVCPMRNLHSTRPIYTFVNRTLNFPGVIAQKIRSTMSFFNPNKYRLKATGSFLYEEIADTIDYNKFYKEFSLPDTFYSWFVITELHVWMLMVRCMAEGVDGQVLRNSIVQSMWDDVNQRTKKLETTDTQVVSSVVKKQVQQLSEQFNACIIAYDEGITGDDKVLAAALWRRFLQSEGNDPVKLEHLVHYVRKQCLQYPLRISGVDDTTKVKLCSGGFMSRFKLTDREDWLTLLCQNLESSTKKLPHLAKVPPFQNGVDSASCKEAETVEFLRKFDAYKQVFFIVTGRHHFLKRRT